MRHVRESTSISLEGSGDKRALAQVGYFHGYKGYRYAGHPSKRIAFTEFKQLRAVMEFDSSIKGLIYPVLMRVEMTMKNLALVEILEAAESSALVDVYTRLMPGTKREKKQGKLKVIHANNETLLKAYTARSSIICHYYDSPQEAVPVWALIEIMTLGQFARFIEQLSDSTLNAIATRWGMRRSDGTLVPHMVYAITSLRNCVAHNGVVFDTRFANEKVRKEIPQLLTVRMGFAPGVQPDFKTITDYFILAAYLACCLGFSKTEVRALIRQYRAYTELLRQRVPKPVFDMIVHTNNRPKLVQLEAWVRAAR
jgi:abortive infection bacteriophage resistance protein